MCNGLSVHAYVTADCVFGWYCTLTLSMNITHYHVILFLWKQSALCLGHSVYLLYSGLCLNWVGSPATCCLFGMKCYRLEWDGNPRSPRLTYHFKSYCCYQFVFFIHVSFVLRIKIYVLILDL